MINTLQQSIDQDQFSHAVLLEGSSGYGVLPIALYISSYLVCKRRSANGPCGQCSSCHKSFQYIHPDIHFAFPVVAKAGSEKRKDITSKNYMKEWRTALDINAYMSLSEWVQNIASTSAKPDINVAECNEIIRQLSLQSFEDGPKVQIIWMAEYLGNNGNRLLKLIEEPPADTFILLICDNAEFVLNTIKSRCRMIRIPRIDQESMRSYLLSHHQLSSTRVDEISFLSEGDVYVALSHLHHDEMPMLPIALSLFDLSKQNDAIAMRDWTDTFNGYNSQQQQSVLRYILQLLREILHSQWLGGDHLRLTSEEIKFIDQRPFLKGINTDQIKRINDVLSEALYLLERNVHVKTLMYNSCLQIESALNSDVYK